MDIVCPVCNCNKLIYVGGYMYEKCAKCEGTGFVKSEIKSSDLYNDSLSDFYAHSNSVHEDDSPLHAVTKSIELKAKRGRPARYK
jgi:hypothetical protein